MSATRPQSNEYLEYYGKYISLVPEGDIITILTKQIDDTLTLLRGIPETKADFRYAPDKWSIKEMVGHVIDSERIFSYRALRFARNDKNALPGYEQDDYIKNSAFDNYPLSELIAEFEHVRQATIFLFKHLEDNAWSRNGTASNANVTVRALAYIIAGHELHHVQVLRTKYLNTGK